MPSHGGKLVPGEGREGREGREGGPFPEGHPIVRFLSWNLLLPSQSFFPASLPKRCRPPLGDSQLPVSMNSQITFLSSLGRGKGHKEGQESITPFFVTHPLLTPVTTQGQESKQAKLTQNVICPTCQEILALICPLVDFEQQQKHIQAESHPHQTMIDELLQGSQPSSQAQLLHPDQWPGCLGPVIAINREHFPGS